MPQQHLFEVPPPLGHPSRVGGVRLGSWALRCLLMVQWWCALVPVSPRHPPPPLPRLRVWGSLLCPACHSFIAQVRFSHRVGTSIRHHHHHQGLLLPPSPPSGRPAPAPGGGRLSVWVVPWRRGWDLPLPRRPCASWRIREWDCARRPIWSAAAGVALLPLQLCFT